MVGSLGLALNCRIRSADAISAIVDAAVPLAEHYVARDSIPQWPAYTPTLLHDLSGRAGEMGIARLAYKDESTRFGLKSFKALGGGFAVQRHLQQTLAEQSDGPVVIEALLAGDYRKFSRGITFAAATDGNHGRAVAWAAKLFGCDATIFIHESVSPGRERAIAMYGATVRRVSGVYEDALRACEREAKDKGWVVISDTASADCMESPRMVMAGYTVMVDEAITQWHLNQTDSAPPTHIFIQAGVGGLATSVIASMHRHYGVNMPRIIVVEPTQADCCFRSAQLGYLTSASGDLNTICAGLACGEPSLLAWNVLDAAAFAFMTIEDSSVVTEMCRLASPLLGDTPLVAGESAACGLAGLAKALCEPDIARALGLTSAARILVFGSEGDTDPELYAKFTASTAP